MTAKFADILKNLVSTHGTDVFNDANLCENLLSEHSAKHKRDTRLLIEILKNNFYKRLQASSNRTYDKKKIAKQLYEEYGIDAKIAEKVLDCLCHAAFGDLFADKIEILPAEKDRVPLTVGIFITFFVIALIIMVFILESVSKLSEEQNSFSSTADIANNEAEDAIVEYNFFKDERDNKIYKTVTIGSLAWFAENLSFKAGNSWCYDNDEFNCKKYGRLYDWNTAKVACPSGWHLPSRAEWNDMVSVIGSNVAGKKLKSKNDWNRIGRIGTDEYGFCALPGGRRFTNGSFRLISETGNWWTSSECSSLEAYYRYMNASISEVGESNYYRKTMGFSVRCVK
jgi:uncharacterized protein (TIGR02145 family)